MLLLTITDRPTRLLHVLLLLLTNLILLCLSEGRLWLVIEIVEVLDVFDLVDFLIESCKIILLKVKRVHFVNLFPNPLIFWHQILNNWFWLFQSATFWRDWQVVYDTRLTKPLTFGRDMLRSYNLRLHRRFGLYFLKFLWLYILKYIHVWLIIWDQLFHGILDL